MKKQSDHLESLSRRRFMTTSAVGGAVLLGATLFDAPTLAANKMPQKAVRYRTTPNGKSQCSNCIQWQPPSSCKVVDGKISPTGWCTLYANKS